MKTLTKAIIGGIAALAAFVTINSGLYTVDQTEQAVITKFGKPTKVIVNPLKTEEDDKDGLAALSENYRKSGIAFEQGPGLKWKMPFIESANMMSAQYLSWDGSPEEITTGDKRNIYVDSTARWRIADPLKFFKTVRTENAAQSRLDDIIDSAVRESISKTPLIEAIRWTDRELVLTEQGVGSTREKEKTVIEKGREQIMQDITEKAAKACMEQYGIELIDVPISRINYISSVQQAIEDRMISERQRVAATYRAEGDGEAKKIDGQRDKELKRISSEAYKTAQEAKGVADGTAIEIYAEAYSKDPSFFQFYRTTSMYPEALKGAKVIFGNDNEMWKYLKDPQQ